ncbi:LytR C-terminal domain-containing protein [Georgenia halophila]|uniref:LytR C-terminal domain-containing protein n=1 Tax=Georgenia halophila TaxID=620889 RepID=A0ABP8KSJ9_9MICO
MTTPDEYPEDEFDVAGRERSPQGVHRGARPLWRALLPVLAVIVLAPLLAWGAIELLGRAEEEPPPSAETTEQTTGGEETTAEPTGEETTTPEQKTTEETPEDETTAANIDYDTTITVLNGAGVAGLAGETAQQLNAEGFTDTVAEDYGFAQPAVTTLYYENPELQATAEEVASILGISNVVESAEATVSIAVVLRSDFAG